MKKAIITLLLTFLLLSCSYIGNKHEQNMKKNNSIITKNSIENNKITTEKVIQNNTGIITKSNTGVLEDLNIKVILVKKEKENIRNFKEIKECNSLKYLKNECNDSFNIELAEKTNSNKYCNKINNFDKKQGCKNFINYNNQNCSYIKGDDLLKKRCLNEVKTIKEQNKLVEKEYTIINTAKNNDDYKICLKLSNIDKVIKCVKPMVIEQKNMNICNQAFKIDDDKQKCINQISYYYDKAIIKEAFETKNPQICEQAYSNDIKKECKQMTY